MRGGAVAVADTMVPGGADDALNEYTLMGRLREKGVEIMVSGDGERVGVGKGQASLLDAEERRAFRQHRAELAVHAMFDGALKALAREARDLGGLGDYAYEEALDALARAGWDGPLDAALYEADREGVRKALDDLLAAVRRHLAPPAAQPPDEPTDEPPGEEGPPASEDSERFFLGGRREPAAEDAGGALALPGF